MKVALVIASSLYASYEPANSQVDPPLGILQLATLLKDDYDIRIFDGQLEMLTPESMADEILGWEPDLIGFSVNFSTVATNSRFMAEYIRNRAPHIPIIFGGNYSTFNCGTLIEQPYVDYILLRESEMSFPALLSYIRGDTKKPPGGMVSRERDGTVRETIFEGYIKNLDELPYCDYDLLDDSTRYVKSIVSSRGCPYSCIYCSTKAMWNKWRCRSAKNVAGEMLSIYDKYKPDRILFSDDNFLVRRDRAAELSEMLKKKGIPVEFGFSARLENIDDDIIPVLARAGCRWIFLGIESGSSDILGHMNRKYTPEECIEKVQMCADNGITCTCSFIIGLPWEDERNVRQTFDLINRISTHRVLLNIFSPLPGTQSMEKAGDYGITFIGEPDTERMVVGHGHVSFNTSHLTARQIEDLWLEGQGIIMQKGRQQEKIETYINRNRYGLMGTSRS